MQQGGGGWVSGQQMTPLCVMLPWRGTRGGDIRARQDIRQDKYFMLQVCSDFWIWARKDIGQQD